MAGFAADPRTPSLLWLLASVMLSSAAALLWLPRVPWSRLNHALRTVPRGMGMLSGVVVTLTMLLIGQALGLAGLKRILLWLISLLVALFLGVYLPGLEARQHAARRRRLQVQAIDLAGYMLLALHGPYGEVAILRAYVQQPRRSVRDIQTIIADVLADHARQSRGNLLDLLHEAAVSSGAEAFSAVTATLKQVLAQDRRSGPQALRDQRQRLLEETVATFKRRAQRLGHVIMLASALSLFCGLLIFILYVMTAGGMILQLF